MLESLATFFLLEYIMTRPWGSHKTQIIIQKKKKVLVVLRSLDLHLCLKSLLLLCRAKRGGHPPNHEYAGKELKCWGMPLCRWGDIWCSMGSVKKYGELLCSLINNIPKWLSRKASFNNDLGIADHVLWHIISGSWDSSRERQFSKGKTRFRYEQVYIETIELRCVF